MKKIVLAFLVVGVLLGGIAAALGFWMLREDAGEWSTDSKEARQAFEAGLEDTAKRYSSDARAHFERAIELDPNFVAAKLYFRRFTHGKERERLNEEIAGADLTQLTDRERFLVHYELAEESGKDGEEILEEFIREHPTDPFGMTRKCYRLWVDQEWGEAESCFEGLLKLHPNWVDAENNLGYLAMAQGRFSDAEEHFRTYRYIAPDQANPYDSLGELLVVLGRYDEAEAALEEALRIKPDFCAAYPNLFRKHAYTREFDEIEPLLARLAQEDSCTKLEEGGFQCAVRVTADWLQGDLEAAWQRFEEDCLEKREFDLVGYRVALGIGRPDIADAMEQAIRSRIEQMDADGKPVYANVHQGFLTHAQGVRLLLGGDALAAAEKFRLADEKLPYWNGDLASVKQFNRLHLFHALTLAGESVKAKAIRQKIEAVNPRLIDEMILPDVVGLRPGQAAAAVG